jgi:hypothetical protein
MVIVMIGMRCIVPLPDRDVDLGVMGPNDLITIGQRVTAQGIVYEPYVVKRNSALGQRLKSGTEGSPVMVPADEDALQPGRTI